MGNCCSCKHGDLYYEPTRKPSDKPYPSKNFEKYKYRENIYERFDDDESNENVEKLNYTKIQSKRTLSLSRRNKIGYKNHFQNKANKSRLACSNNPKLEDATLSNDLKGNLKSKNQNIQKSNSSKKNCNSNNKTKEFS